MIFYLEHFILSQRNSALFRAKCERDFHRVILLSKLLSVAVAAVQTVLSVLMLVYVVKFAQSASIDKSYAWMIGVLIGLLLLRSAWLFHISPLLALAPWVFMFSFGYLLQRIFVQSGVGNLGVAV